MTNNSANVRTLSRRRFGTVMLGGVAVPLLGSISGCSAARTGLSAPAVRAKSDGLSRIAPESAGVRSEAILAFLDDVDRAGLELHSMMLSRGGNVVAEGWWWPFMPDRIHMSHSLTKSVTATAIGLAVDEGLMSLEDRVAGFFPDELPESASANLLAMTVYDLLTMRTGHDRETSGSVWRPIPTSWVTEFMKIPVPHRPGTKFVYTSAASFMLSAILTKVTGKTMEAYLRPRLLDPLGIDTLQWDLSPGGINTGGNGLSWPTSASLKLGMLYVQRGMWNGQRILSEQWVKNAGRDHVGGEEPYGYQWWVGPQAAYYALGLFGQIAIVFPEHDAVLAFFAAIDGSSKILPFVWKHFPAAFETRSMAISPATSALMRRTATLCLLPELILTSSPIVSQIDGRTYQFEPNDQGVTGLRFDAASMAIGYTMNDGRGEHVVLNGLDRWIEQDTSVTGARLHHEYEPDAKRIVAGGRWRDANTLELTWQYVEAAFRDTVVCRFAQNTVTIDRSVNLNTREMQLPKLVGRLV